jgi:uncharacterized membrane protein (DUF485 family)
VRAPTRERPTGKALALDTDLHTTTEARARAHWRVAITIIAAIGVLYSALILLIAFNKPFLARVVVPGLSRAILLGAFVTVAAWILTLIYVRWANGHEKPLRRP